MEFFDGRSTEGADIMKYGMKYTGRALALAVALALTGSTALAMPTGGTVASGDVTGLTDGTVASGGTIATNAASIINWEAFGLKAGESLILNTTGGALLNRVTGGNPSEIYGTLTQTGSNLALLVNPNGIIVGDTGIINSQSLMLTTLAVTDEDFKTWIGGTGSAAFTTPSGKTVAEPVKFEKGAMVNATTSMDGDQFFVLGGTVEVADGVTFTSTGNRPGFNFQAAQTDTEKINNYGTDTTAMTATPENSITFSGTLDGTNTNNESYLNFLGGKVTLDGADIELSDHEKTYYSSEIDIAAFDHFAGDVDYGSVSRSAANAVTLTNSKLKADGIYVIGGTLKNTKTTITVGDDGFNTYIGSGGLTMYDSLYDREIIEANDTANAMVEPKAAAALGAETQEASVTVEGKPADETAIPGASTSPTDASAAAGTGTNASGTVGIRAAAASAAAVLGGRDAAADAAIQQNAAYGYQAMEEALSGADTAAGRMSRTTDLIRMIDEDKTLDAGAKTAQAYGMIRAIDDNAQMSEEEKKRLKKLVAQNFRSLSADVRTQLLSIASTAAARNE